MKFIQSLLFVVLAAQVLAAADHPFIIWTPKEAATIRERVEREPWAAEEYARAAEDRRARDGLYDLFRFGVMGDREAGEREKKILLDSVRSGKVKGSYVMPLRYDILHPILTAGERLQVEKAFRSYIDMAMSSMAQREYNRYNWLPNLGYPWYLSAHLMAVSLRDVELARKVFESSFGLKWYFDEYLSDSGFYNEEFGKMYNTPDAILLWCRACERLGVNDIGYEYRGRQGATSFGHIESVLRLGMPRVDLGTSRPHYPRLSMGDAKGSRSVPAYGFQHALVDGWLEHRYAGKSFSRWRLGRWCWFELAHQKWPEAGFGYFLAQRRGPDDDRYYPSLLFGLEPVDPERVSPPSAPSGVYPGRGLVVLRAEEGPGYWESAAPALGMRLATPYAHHVQDCFSLTGFYAFNRPLYVNRKHATNYSGVDPGWSNSARSHSTVIVDFQEPKTTGPVDLRHDFSETAKFVAARGSGIYEGVDQTRALVLTRDYLFDVFRLRSKVPRHYQWIVQAVGNGFAESTGRREASGAFEEQEWTRSMDLQGFLPDCAEEHSLVTDDDWSVTVVQSSGGANRDLSGLGNRWFEQRVGARITMLGEESSSAYLAWAPAVNDSSGKWRGRDRFCFGEDEPAGTTVIAVRKKRETTFAAVHEPFRTRRKVGTPLRLESASKEVIGVRLPVSVPDSVGMSPRMDYILLDLRDERQDYVTVGRDREQWQFRDYAFVRVEDGRIDVHGDVSGFVLPGDGSSKKLRLNGDTRPLRQLEGRCEFGSLRLQSAPEETGEGTLADDRRALAARWMPGSALCLPAGGAATRVLRLMNVDRLAATGEVRVEVSNGLLVEPDVIRLDSLKPGGELEVPIRVSGHRAPVNELGELRLAGDNRRVKVNPAALTVAHGVCTRRDLHRAADFAETVFSPRYIAKVHYMESGATSLLLDPMGYRRSDSSSSSYPQIVRFGVDERGREGWHAENVRKFPYFVPVVIPGGGEKPAYVYEAGWHAHGTRSAVEHRFTEDWISVRFREADEDERIAFNWIPDSRRNGLEATILGRDARLAADQAPGKVCVATLDGTLHDAGDPNSWPRRADLPREVEEITAVFLRPHGYEYGTAMLYPPGARREGSYVTQPGTSAMAFTFCKEEEFPAVIERWKENQPPQEATELERRIYGGAFMPHLE